MIKLFSAIKLALMVWSFTKLQLLVKRANEIEEEIDNIGIDASKSDIMRIKRLAREKQRIDKLLNLADSVFSKDH